MAGGAQPTSQVIDPRDTVDVDIPPPEAALPADGRRPRRTGPACPGPAGAYWSQ
jgi:hypothetical protein